MQYTRRFIDGTTIQANISNNGYDVTLPRLLAGDGWWLRYTNKNIDTLIHFFGFKVDAEHKKFEVDFKKYLIYSDNTSDEPKFDKNIISDEQGFDDFFMLSELAFTYQHLNIKACINGFCKKYFAEPFFDNTNGNVLPDAI